MNDLSKELEKAIQKEKESELNNFRRLLSHAVLKPICEDWTEGIVLHEWDLGEKRHTLVLCVECKNKHILKTKIPVIVKE